MTQSRLFQPAFGSQLFVYRDIVLLAKLIRQTADIQTPSETSLASAIPGFGAACDTEDGFSVREIAYSTYGLLRARIISRWVRARQEELTVTKFLTKVKLFHSGSIRPS